jgi:Holliday junction resolvase
MEKFIIETKVNGKKANLELNQSEVESAISICESNNTDDVIIMKKHNGGALFFTDPRHANQCQERHKFDYAYTVAKTDLSDFIKKKTTGAKSSTTKKA